jgi:hypothetical protein
MSSTNRGSSREVSDYYVTPQWAIREFLGTFVQVSDHGVQDLCAGTLDPCAGGSVAAGMAYPEALVEFGAPPDTILTIDIRDDSRADIKADYLRWAPPADYKPWLIITNPPFSHAAEIAAKAIAEVEDGGFVVMLQRLNFLGTDCRREFWGRHRPKWVFVHRRRMRFNGAKSTDSIEYAHFVWQRGHREEHRRRH